MKALLILALAATLSAEETLSNGMRIETKQTTEGLTVRVVPSSCNTEAIRVQLRTSKPGGNWDMQQDFKGVIRCDSRPVEFRFSLPGAVVLVAAYELTGFNSGSAK